LKGYILSDQLGINLGPLDFLDINKDFFGSNLLELLLQVLHLYSLFPDDDAGPCRVDADLGLFSLAGSPFNLNLGYPGMIELFLQMVPDPNIFDEELRIILLGIPP
jgi:hypothetical protein